MQRGIIEERRWLCTLKQEISIAKQPVNANICLYAWFKASSKTGCELLFGLVWMGRVMFASGVQHAATPPPCSLSASLLLSPSVFVSQLLSHSLCVPPLNKGTINVNMLSSLCLCFPLSLHWGGICMNGYQRGGGALSLELVEFDTTERKALYYTCTEWVKVRFLVEFIIQEAAGGHCTIIWQTNRWCQVEIGAFHSKQVALLAHLVPHCAKACFRCKITSPSNTNTNTELFWLVWTLSPSLAFVYYNFLLILLLLNGRCIHLIPIYLH